MITKEQVVEELARRQYKVVHETAKKQGWQLGAGRPVYINLMSVSGETVLVLHPELAAQDLADAVEGARCGDAYFHSSNLKLFPKRLHRGVNPIGYGWGVSFDSTRALQRLLDQVEAVE